MTRAECAQWLLDRDNFLILTHRRPDGDTIGSAATLCLGLRSLGKSAFILENREITKQYAHLHRGLTVTEAASDHTVVTVDVAAENLLPADFSHLISRIALRIDHHATAESFGAHQLVDGACGACGEIIYDVLSLMGVQLTREMAEALYIAVSTDTGSFRYPNLTAHSFRTAAACADAGADIATINRELFDTNSFRKMKMQSWIIEHTRFHCGGQVAVCAIPRDVEQELGVNEDDMENISGLARSIEGVRMAATLRQSGDGKVKVSIRAIPGYDAAAVCREFGGGGHKGAAGATLDMLLNQAAAAVAEALTKYFGEQGI